jgi:Secretion system C-terminal sorting domain
MSLNYDYSNFFFGKYDKVGGFSVRCLNDLYVSEIPVELYLFTAVPNERTIRLNWETKTEKNSNKFEIERFANLTWANIGSVKASVLSNSPKQYSYTDKNLQAGKYQYRLKMIDNDGTFEYSKTIEAEVAVPKNFELSQNFPNPFNPNTVISYSLPLATDVKLTVYNTLGQTVKILENGFKNAGTYSVNFNAAEFPSGTYYYKIEAGQFSQVKKMILLK